MKYYEIDALNLYVFETANHCIYSASRGFNDREFKKLGFAPHVDKLTEKLGIEKKEASEIQEIAERSANHHVRRVRFHHECAEFEVYVFDGVDCYYYVIEATRNGKTKTWNERTTVDPPIELIAEDCGSMLADMFNEENTIENMYYEQQKIEISDNYHYLFLGAPKLSR